MTKSDLVLQITNIEIPQQTKKITKNTEGSF